jgi:hypothetical protein
MAEQTAVGSAVRTVEWMGIAMVAPTAALWVKMKVARTVARSAERTVVRRAAKLAPSKAARWADLSGPNWAGRKVAK